MLGAHKKNRIAAVFGVSRQTALVGSLFAWAFWAVEPVGQGEQAKNYKHDDEYVMGLHGNSLFKGEVEIKKTN
jgi:hypothetical protein